MHGFFYSYSELVRLTFSEAESQSRSHRTNLISGTANAYGSRLIDTICREASDTQNLWKAVSFNMIADIQDLFPTEENLLLDLVYEKTVMRSLMDSVQSLESAMENFNGICQFSNALSDQLLLSVVILYEAQIRHYSSE